MRKGRSLAASALPLALIHRSSWKRSSSTNFALTGFSEVGGQLYVFTGRNTGKVKRIRNGGGVLVCPCNMRGRPRRYSRRGPNYSLAIAPRSSDE